MGFIPEKPNDKLDIQVSETLSTEEVRERELRPLKLIQDNYEKIILSMDLNPNVQQSYRYANSVRC